MVSNVAELEGSPLSEGIDKGYIGFSSIWANGLAWAVTEGFFQEK